MSRERATLVVRASAFLLFHPNDFPDLPEDGLFDVPESARVEGLVIGLRLGAGGLRRAELLVDEPLTEEDRVEISGPPWLFRLEVRHGALFPGDHLEPPSRDRAGALAIPNGRYRVEWFRVRSDTTKRRDINWLVRLEPVSSFDGIGAWLDPPYGTMPNEDMFTYERTPRLVDLGDLTDAEARARRALKSVDRMPPEPFRVTIEGEKRFILDGPQLRIEAPGEEPFSCAVPPKERLDAAAMLRRFAPWWFEKRDLGGKSGKSVRITIDAADGHLDVFAACDGTDAKVYEFMDAFAQALVRRAKTLVAFEALVRSGLPADVELYLTWHGRRLETTTATLDRNAFSELLVKNEIWAAPMEPIPAPSVTIELRVPALGEYHYPLRFWGKDGEKGGADGPASAVAAVRDFLAAT